MRPGEMQGVATAYHYLGLIERIRMWGDAGNTARTKETAPRAKENNTSQLPREIVE